MSGQHLGDAVEAAARMLPAQIPDGGTYDVARAVVRAALPHIEAHLGGPRLTRLQTAVLEIHQRGELDADGFAGCAHDGNAWPCPTAWLCMPR